MSQNTDTMDATFKRRLCNPYWVDNMSAWHWMHDGRLRVGPAVFSDCHDVGHANLIWLALDLPAPPRTPIDVNKNQIYVWVAIGAWQFGLDKLAAMHTLEEFAVKVRALATTTKDFRSSQMMIFLAMLAERRLNANSR